jgi:hypothetical protein
MATQNLKGIIGYRPTTTRQLRLGQLRLGNYDSVNYDSVYYDSVNYDSSQLRLDQLRLQSITTPVNTTRLFEGTSHMSTLRCITFYTISACKSYCCEARVSSASPACYPSFIYSVCIQYLQRLLLLRKPSDRYEDRQTNRHTIAQTL